MLTLCVRCMWRSAGDLPIFITCNAVELSSQTFNPSFSAGSAGLLALSPAKEMVPRP